MMRLTKWFFGFGLLATSLSLAAAAEDNVLKVKVGDAMPDISLAATQIAKVLPDAKDTKELSLKAFAGKKNVVLFFYPRANTPGCTVESCGFRDLVEEFAKLDTVVIGASNDKLEAQEKFTKDHELKTPLLADPESKLIKALGILSDKGNAAKRFTFVVNKEGKIAKIYDKVTPKGHPTEVLTFVKEKLKS